MTQFHVYELDEERLIIDLQSDFTETGTRVVAPMVLEAGAGRRFTKLEPAFQIKGRTYIMHTPELAAVPSSLTKGASIANLSEHDYDIRKALDMVFSGF